MAPLAAGVRCATLALAGLVGATQGELTPGVLAWAVVLGAVAVWRSPRSGTRDRGGRRPPGPGWFGMVAEVGVNVVAVVTTGSWGSPLVVCLLGSVMAAGLAWGFLGALTVALSACAAITTVYDIGLGAVPGYTVESTMLWALQLVLVALLGGYTRRLFGEAEQRHSLALQRMSQLSEANDLLVSLHRVAQSLPASLNLDQVLSSTVTRLRSLIDCDVVGILLRDDASGGWTMGAGEGAALPQAVREEHLCGPLKAATTSSVASLVVSLGPGEGLGPEVLARSGLYAPLRARGALIGLVAVEHHEAGFYGRRELRLLDGFIESAALAIDNARWFGRLRTMGADEERVRIARDMHDSVGQSLAYVAFKLDRLTGIAEGTLRQELDALRNEVRGVLTEVRDALCDLRAEVSEERSLVDTLEAFLDRVQERADFDVSFWHHSTGRLPVVQEREIWRIAHEAVNNVEHHARARNLRVRWECDGRRATLTIADDGQGFPVGGATRTDAYGIRGMRERANAIGARLEIDSEPYVGTVVECRLPATLPDSVAGHRHTRGAA